MRIKFIKFTAYTLAVLAFVANLTACSKSRTDLTEAQKTQLFNISEAFYESGFNFSNGSVLNNSDLEMFVYYLYNDELTAGTNGFASISLETADAMVKSIFGMGPALHKNYNSDGSSPLYSNDRNYFIKVVPSQISSYDITELTLGEDGHYRTTICLVDKDGTTTELKMVFHLENDDEVRVLECMQYVSK